MNITFWGWQILMLTSEECISWKQWWISLSRVDKSWCSVTWLGLGEPHFLGWQILMLTSKEYMNWKPWWTSLSRVDKSWCSPRKNASIGSLGEHHFLGLTNPDVNLKRMHQLFCYMIFFSFTLFFVIFLSSLIHIFLEKYCWRTFLFAFLKAFLFILTTDFRKDKSFFLD